MYRVREMQESDWEQIKNIYEQGIDTNIATFQTKSPPYEEFDRSYQKECRLVAADGDIVIGWTALSPVSSRRVYRGVAEVSVYVHSGYKGKRVGTLLLNHLISKSEECGVWTLQSSIMEDNAASIKLHEKCGFRLVGYRERIGQDRFGTWRNTILMERRSKVL